MTVLISRVSIECPSDMLPPRPTAVTVTPRVACEPLPIMHVTDVSDLHSVPSHPVIPIRPDTLAVIRPKGPPCTVTHTDPVPIPLDPSEETKLEVSIEYADDVLPIWRPNVIVIRSVPPAPPCPASPLTDDADSHAVPLHAVCPALTIAVRSADPKLPPCIVTDMDSVPFVLPPVITLIMPTSTEYPSDMLPAHPPTVADTRRLPPPP